MSNSETEPRNETQRETTQVKPWRFGDIDDRLRHWYVDPEGDDDE